MWRSSRTSSSTRPFGGGRPRSRDQIYARTPALVTAVSREGEGSITVVYIPALLVLRCGFSECGWKRREGVPLADARASRGQIGAELETALLRVLREAGLGRARGPRLMYSNCFCAIDFVH